MSPAGGKKQEDNPQQDSKSYVENFDESENPELHRVAGAEQTALYQNSYHKAVDKGILPSLPQASKYIFWTLVGGVIVSIIVVATLVLTYISQIYLGEWMTEGQKQILTDCLASIKVFLLGAIASPLVRKFIKF